MSTQPESAISKAEDKTNHYLTLASIGVGVAVAGIVYPPLHVTSVAINLYCCFPIFQAAYHAIAKERRLRAPIIDALAAAGALLTRYYVALALGNWCYYVAEKLLHQTEDRARKHLVNIFGEQPRSVWALIDGVEVEMPVVQLQAGDIVVVHAGQMIPVDGVIRTGTATVDQHMLTGEAQPVEKGMGDQVFAATIVLAGRMHIQVEKTGAATMAAQIGVMLNRAADYKMVIESHGRQLADGAVLPTLGVSALALSTLGPAGAVAVLNANFSEVLRIAAPSGQGTRCVLWAMASTMRLR